MIPTCVLLVDRPERLTPPPPQVPFPTTRMGGGFPALTLRQGQPRVGTVGCLVTDGRVVYALTNHHVAGEPGEAVHTRVRGKDMRIGESTGTGLARVPFTEAYRNWPGRHAVSTIDAGLIRLDEVTNWSAQVFGMGVMGELVDLNVDTLSLNLIGCPVAAHGAGSGPMRGRILALFYRYKTVGGTDYIADFLIGPRSGDESLMTRPGDSGALWFYDRASEPPSGPLEKARGSARQRSAKTPPEAAVPDPRPLAMQWGGQLFTEEGAAVSFALATNLANVCRLLGLDLVRDWGISLPPYWGKLGHFAIAQTAVGLLAATTLHPLLQANLDRITHPMEVFTKGEVPTYKGAEFVPLADVPDLIWKARDATLKRPNEDGNHYLNLDLKADSGYGGRLLKSLWLEDRTRLDPEYFTAFYDACTGQGKPGARGALPFRIWQLYDEMVDALRAKARPRFIGLAGVLAHYMADACMPLHNTQYHHGYPGATDKQEAVHGYIDNDILSVSQGSTLVKAFEQIGDNPTLTTATGGQGWGQRAMELMVWAFGKVSPKRIITAYNATLEQEMDWRDRYDYMVKKIGTPLRACIATGTVRLAELWLSAWKEGDGDKAFGGSDAAVSCEDLSDLYLDPKGFAPCRLLSALEVRNGRLELKL
ncbi:MAG: hypothetical protein FJX74_12065 [Armatimonadetes bacterium]|nr:hypothetical protein [Armatimonadota bacterium]